MPSGAGTHCRCDWLARPCTWSQPVSATRLGLHLGTRRFRYEEYEGLDGIRDRQIVGIGMVLLAGAFRLAFSQQCTSFIKSLAHTLGRRHYSIDNSARDSGVVALLTWGEGYHNFHHAFQTDYRNGIRWWQFDPGKWLIRSAAWLGLAGGLRRTPAFKVRRARLQVEFRELQERLAGNPAAMNWADTLDREYRQFRETVAQWQAVQADRFAAGKAALRDRWCRTELATRYRELEYRLKMQARRLATLRRVAALA